MTAPRTRIEEGATEFERELLRSWQREQPSESAREATLALAASIAPTGATGAATGVKAATGLHAASGSIAPKAATLGAAAMSKWAVVGASVIALAAAGTAVQSVRSSSTPDVVATTTPTATAVPAPIVTTTATATTTATSIATSEAPSVATSPQPATTKPRAAAPAAPEPAAPALDLRQQVAALDRASSALASGHAAEALRAIDEYDRQFPRGALAQEATALRIEALLQQGDRDAAVRMTDRFLASNPKSPHAARIRVLVQRAH